MSIKAVRAIDPPLELSRLKAIPELEGMELLRKGSRLSVQPVTPQEWKVVMALPAWHRGKNAEQTTAGRAERIPGMARLEHFAIYAADPAALKDFYVQTMGLLSG